MKLLVLDSSGLVASVALIEDDQLIAEYTTGNKLTHSQTLLPMLDEVIKRTSFEIEDIDAVVVAKGPGSFTGLRIGAATAKGLGLALDKPIIPVPTVDGLAYQLFGTSMIICPMMDARRKQVYPPPPPSTRPAGTGWPSRCRQASSPPARGTGRPPGGRPAGRRTAPGAGRPGRAAWRRRPSGRGTALSIPGRLRRTGWSGGRAAPRAQRRAGPRRTSAATPRPGRPARRRRRRSPYPAPPPGGAARPGG